MRIASFPGPCPAFRRLQYDNRTAQVMESWAGLGMRLPCVHTHEYAHMVASFPARDMTSTSKYKHAVVRILDAGLFMQATLDCK